MKMDSSVVIAVTIIACGFVWATTGQLSYVGLVIIAVFGIVFAVTGDVVKATTTISVSLIKAGRDVWVAMAKYHHLNYREAQTTERERIRAERVIGGQYAKVEGNMVKSLLKTEEVRMRQKVRGIEQKDQAGFEFDPFLDAEWEVIDEKEG